MNSDYALRQVFRNEVLRVQGRPPRPDEIARAVVTCTDRRGNQLRRFFHDSLPMAVLAAACLIAVVSGLPGSGLPRPLASELTRTIPADAGDSFIVLMVATGDYFRSADR